jgi:C1A family cysteine protease
MIRKLISPVLITAIMILSLAFASAQDIGSINQAIQWQGAGWTAGETSMSRLSESERQKRVGLLVPDVMPETPMVSSSDAPAVGLPSRFDWRDANFVTPARNQSGCASCWAFASTAALESYVLIRNKTPGIDLDLSEQVLISCANAGGCGGGYINKAADFFVSTGLTLESCYTYTHSDGWCGNACPSWNSATYKLNKWSYVSNPSMSYSVNSIKDALVNYGPLATTMVVYQDFYNYKSGVYSYVSGSLAGGHGVTLVGYDDSSQCFIVKNTWGQDWGENGFFRIAYSEMYSQVKFAEWTIAYGNAVTLPVSPPTPPPPPSVRHFDPSPIFPFLF